MYTTVRSTDPHTGLPFGPGVPETDSKTLEGMLVDAEVAFDDERFGDRAFRARMLREIADALEAAGEPLVELAQRETAFSGQRLAGELSRTAFQARHFSEVLDDGAYLGVAIDHPAQTSMGAGPDLRRMLVPIGPVAVFGASNFPFAFSVLGGDTISALAAGCPVVFKAHESHPSLASATYEVFRGAADAMGVPAGTLSMIFGRPAGALAASHQRIRAVAFTGSLAGGRAILDIVNERSDPIPFYGELSSLNPVVISPEAATSRGVAIGKGLVASFTGSSGQLCTKPGLVFVPVGPAGDAIASVASSEVQTQGGQTLLNVDIARAYRERVRELENGAAVRLLALGSAVDSSAGVRSALFEIPAHALDDNVATECFGPATVLVRYEKGELSRSLNRLPGTLAAAVFAESNESRFVSSAVRVLKRKVGRLLFDAWPTGVHVSWAQHHGGPWPATNSLHTSVGATALDRFLRPVTWQNAPGELLPIELRDDYSAIPRRLDGVL